MSVIRVDRAIAEVLASVSQSRFSVQVNDEADLTRRRESDG